MKINESLIGIIFFVGLMVLAMVSGLFINQMFNLDETDNRIWCYVKTVSSINDVVLNDNQVAIHTRGGIDVMEKCDK